MFSEITVVLRHLTSFCPKMQLPPYWVFQSILILHFNLSALHFTSGPSFANRENAAFLIVAYMWPKQIFKDSQRIFLLPIRNRISHPLARPSRITWLWCDHLLFPWPSERKCWKEAGSHSLRKGRCKYYYKAWLKKKILLALNFCSLSLSK